MYTCSVQAGCARPEPVGPRQVDEFVSGDGLADAERQLGQRGPLLRASQRHVTVDRSELHRARGAARRPPHAHEFRSQRARSTHYVRVDVRDRPLSALHPALYDA